MAVFDYKKEYKYLYLPKQQPMVIDIPTMSFIMVDGTGDPNGPEYESAMQVMYSLSYTIKMSKMGKNKPEGYFDYVVPPLEGLWWGEKADFMPGGDRSAWRWTSMIRQPEFVTKDVFDWAVAECKKKKPDVNVGTARFEHFTEGLCAQIMHIGPYSDEQTTIQKLEHYIEETGYSNMTSNVRKHHEIYLSDPRKTAPEKLKTVIRLPIE